MTTTPSCKQGLQDTPCAARRGFCSVLYGEIKNLCHYRVGGNRGGITAHIVCQINVYKFYRPCSCLRRNDKKVWFFMTKSSPRRRPGSIVFVWTSKLGGMQWIPACAGMTVFLRVRCRYDDDHYPGTVCHPLCGAKGIFLWGAEVPLRWRGGTQCRGG